MVDWLIYRMRARPDHAAMLVHDLQRFEPVEPELKDVYFSVMAGHHGRRAGQAAGAAP